MSDVSGSPPPFPASQGLIGRPLQGVRVVELARILAGPWCGQLLADLGAEVIKVERPVVGDDTRHWGPPFVGQEGAEHRGAAYFHSANRGKTGVAADIATREGQEAVRALIADADVVIENFKVGGLAKYGLDHASLAEINPRIITCSITGFGQTGPYAPRPGYDFVIQAMGGMMSMTGEPDGPPQKAGIAVADLFTGVYSAAAILAALRRRDQEGIGAHIDMALLDVQLSVMSNQALNWMVSDKVPHRAGNGHANLTPYQAFPVSDGELVIAVGNDSQFKSLCAVLNLDLAADERFAANPGRVIHREIMLERIRVATAGWEKARLAAALDAAGVPAGPINTIAEAFNDPHARARGIQIERDGVPGVASPIVIDGERMVSAGPSPTLARPPH